MVNSGGGEGSGDRESDLYSLRCYDICTENRNNIAHAQYERRRDDKHLFYKEDSEPGYLGWYFALSVAELEELSDAIQQTDLYVTLVWKEASRSRTSIGRQPLPDRPPQPRKLSWFSRIEAPEGEQATAKPEPG